MKTTTYRVAPNYFTERSRSGSWASTFDARVQRKGYVSATPVYGPVKNTNSRTARKTPFNTEIIGYDAVRMKTPEEEAKTNTGANRGAVGSLGMSSDIGTAGSAQAGLVGSVNTEVQNDDQLLPYQKL